MILDLLLFRKKAY